MGKLRLGETVALRMTLRVGARGLPEAVSPFSALCSLSGLVAR